MNNNSPAPENRLWILLWTLAVLSWISMLFVESSHPPQEIFRLVPGLDKIAHFFAFGILGLMVCQLSFKFTMKTQLSYFSLPFFVVCFSGMFEEIYQLSIPGRTASVPDLLADILGGLFAIASANRFAFGRRAK